MGVMLVAGIMSGTSVDAIDVALVQISGEDAALDVQPVCFEQIPFPEGVQREVLRACNGTSAVSRVSQLDFLLGRLFGEAVLETCRRSGVPVQDLDLVGSHGQTIHHQSGPTRLCGYSVSSTLQIGEPACIARVLGRPVVADFRPADVAAGGQGAPLVPFADFVLFRHPTLNRVALNIGGIANLTAIPAAAGREAVFAFDTGPGNMVVDGLVQGFFDGEEKFDRDGRIAARGVVDEQLLAMLLENPYYAQPPPKSTGREAFGEEFATMMRSEGLSRESLVATAARLTARSILLAIERFVVPVMPVEELLVSGGGWHNPAIIQPIREGLPRTRVLSTTDYGIDTDAKEAIAFAILAYETFHGQPANLPSATGADGPALLGKIVQPVGRRRG